MIIAKIGALWSEVDASSVHTLPDGAKGFFARPLTTDKWFATNSHNDLVAAKQVADDCECRPDSDLLCDLCAAEAQNREVLNPN